MRRHLMVKAAPLLSVILVAAASRHLASPDVVVAYEVGSAGGGADVDVHARLLKSDGSLGWNGAEESLAIAASEQRETSPIVVADGTGGAIVVYTVEFTDGEHEGDLDIYAQRISPDGALLWNEGKTPRPVATSKGKEANPVAMADGAGGVIVAYEWTDGDGDTDILAQRVSADGDQLWMNQGVPALAATSADAERNPGIVTDTEGGVIVLFEWEGPDGGLDVMAQRITADGKVAWNEGDQAVDVSATAAVERTITAVPDGEGGALVAFEFEIPEGEYKGDIDIMAQRVTGEGVVLWNGGAEPSVLSSGRGIERRPFAIPDGEGGMVVAFEYEPLEGEYAGDIDILAQRISADGDLLWQEGKKSVLASAAMGLERAVRGVRTEGGDVILIFEHEFRGGGEYGGDIDIFAQRISADGRPIWNEGKQPTMVAGSKWLERSPIAVADGEAGAIVVFPTIGPEGEWEGDEDLRAARIAADGSLIWHDSGTVGVAGSRHLERRPSAAMVGSP